MVACEHWTRGVCGLGKFDGRPSFGLCMRCLHPEKTPAQRQQLIRPTISAKPIEFHAIWSRIHAGELTTLAQILAVLPCGKCKDHTREWFAANPDPLTVESARAFHDWVNKLIGKPKWNRS